MVQLYNFATYIHILIFSFTDLNESMNYVHKNLKHAHCSADMNCNLRSECCWIHRGVQRRNTFF